MARRRKKRKPPKLRHGSAGDLSDAIKVGKIPFGEATSGDRIRPWLLAATISLFVSRVLFPSELAAAEGDGQVVVMLWMLLALAWVAGAVGQPELRVRLGWTDAAVGLLIGWHTLAALVAVRNGSPRPALNMLWEWVALGLAFFLARQLFTGRREARAAVAVMIALAVALSSYGLYQYFCELPATRAIFERDPEGTLRAAGLEFGADSTARELVVKRLYSFEPFASFALTNSLAAYLTPWLVVAVGIAIGGFPVRKTPADSLTSAESGTRRNGNGLFDHYIWMTRAGVACLAIPVGSCLLLTKSRAGYLAFCVGLGFLAMAWWHGRRTRGRIGWKPLVTIGAMAILLAACVWGAAAVGGIDIEVLSEASKSLGYRAQYWQSTARMIADHVWFGCGPGQFQNAYAFYKLPRASEEIADPHNFLLEVWATAGTPAVLALLAVLVTFARSLRRVAETPSDTSAEAPAEKKMTIRKASASDAPGFVLGGGLVGFVAAVPIAWASVAPSGEMAVMVGLLPAILTVGVLAPWVWTGRMPASLPPIGVLVLLTSILFSGGMGAAGVAGTLWLLMALGLNMAPRNPAWTCSQGARAAALVVAIILTGCCYLTSYRPVIGCRGAMAAAEVDRAKAQFHLERACSTDRLWARPRIELAGLLHTRWKANPTAVESDLLEECCGTALRLSPRSHFSWHYFASLFHVTGQMTARPEQIAWALDAYRRAVALYPTNCRYRADLAEILNQTGDTNAARREAAEALRLDQITPHADKKLPEQHKQLIRKILMGE